MTYDVSKGGMPSGGGQPSLKETRTGQALNAVATAGGLHAAYLTGKEIHRAVKQGPVEAGKHAKPVKPGRAARVAQKIPAVGRTFKDPRKLAMASLGGWAALHTGELIGDAIAARALHRQAKQAKAAQAKPPVKENLVKKNDLDPRNGVGRRITEVSKADPADPAPAAKRPPLTRKAKGKLAAASLAATAGVYGLMKLGENRNTGDLAFGKARYFDPEADRQRRMGMYSGVLAGGGITAGSLAATRGSFRRVVEPAKEVRGKMRGARYGIKGNKFGYGAAAAAAGLGLAAGAVYNRGISRRNQPWT